MGAKVVGDSPSILACDMKDGEVGVIVEWGDSHELCGTVVQMLDNERLICIGMPSLDGWSSVPADDKCRVRLLNPPDRIELTEDE